MSIIIHILLTTIISVVVGAGVYWLAVWRNDGIMFCSPREFLIGGISAINFFKALIIVGLVLGILTR